jgi:putative membrane protein
MPGAMIPASRRRSKVAYQDGHPGEAFMEYVAYALTALVMVIHIYIVLLETVLFRSWGVKAFAIPPDRVEEMAPVMSNQGCYNLFLVVALAMGLFYAEEEIAEAFTVYGLGCVIVAGIWGGITVARKILLVQTVPATVALAAYIAS